jgi:hypothetical protein
MNVPSARSITSQSVFITAPSLATAPPRIAQDAHDDPRFYHMPSRRGSG